MTPEQKQFYEDMQSALVDWNVDNNICPTQKSMFTAKEALEKLHDLWPTLCELDEVGKKATQFNLISDDVFMPSGHCVRVSTNNGRDDYYLYSATVCEMYRTDDEDARDIDIRLGDAENNAKFFVKSANARPTISKAVGGGDE